MDHETRKTQWEHPLEPPKARKTKPTAGEGEPTTGTSKSGALSASGEREAPQVSAASAETKTNGSSDDAHDV
jgi:hypothetical protein